MLYRVKREYKDGRSTDEIIHSDKPLTLYPKHNQIISSIVHVFKYEVESLLPPTLHVSHRDGTKYIVPMWMEVHPQTQMSDIKWTKWVSKEEKQRQTEKKKETINTWQFESKSEPGTFYTVTFNGSKLKCNCAGMWRSKTRTCKHMKAVQENLVTQN